MAEFNLKLNINGVETAVASIEDLESALKATKTEMATLQVGSEAFNVAAKNARALDSELKNIKKSTEGVDTAKMAGSFAKLGEAVTGAFAIATTAASLFGAENENVTKAAANAQQVLTIVMGARAVAEGIVEGAAAARLIVEKLTLVTTSLLTAATVEQTSATVAQVVATEAQTTAQVALNVAMKAAPYAIIVSAVLALGYALLSSEENTRDFNKELDDLSAKLSIVNGDIKTTISYNEQLASVTADLYDKTGKVGVAFQDTFGNADILSKGDISIAAMKANAELLEGAIKRTGDALESASGSVEAFQKVQGNSSYIVDQQLASYKQIAETFSPGGAGTEGDESRIKNQQELLDLALKAKKIDDEKLALTNQLALLEQKILVIQAEKVAQEADAQKKRIEAYGKELKAVQDITKESTQSRLDAEQQYVNDVKQLQVDLIKNTYVRAQEQLKLDESIKLQEIEATKKVEEQKVIEAIRAGKARDEALSVVRQNAADKEVTVLAETLVRMDLLRQENDAKRKETEAILAAEIGVGDYNLSDRRNKIALENKDFYIQQKLSELELDYQIGQMTVDNTKSTIEAIRLEKENAAIAERDLRYEELQAQRDADIATAEEQFQEGLVTKEQRDITIKGIDDELREQKKQADLNAINEIEIANAESIARTQELEKQKIDATFAIANQSLKATQGLSDLYFAIKMANVQKGSAAEEKAARNQFKINKALAITTTVISTIQGVVNTLMAKSVIPEPYGTILKVVSAVAIGAAGAANVAKISATQFSSAGAAPPSVPAAPSTDVPSDAAGGSAAIAGGSGGGITGFNPSLLGPPAGSTPTGGGGGTPPIKVYVVESDITGAQRSVSVAESNATF